MAMDLAKKTFSCDPDYLIAGTKIPIETATKEAAEAIPAGAPVILDDGKVKKVTATAGDSSTFTVSTDGLYGIAAEDAESGEEAIVYLTGEFFKDALVLESHVKTDSLEVPFREIGIFLK